MAAYGQGFDWPFLAGADLSTTTDRFCVVALSTSANKVIKATGTCGSAGGPIGIQQNSPSSGQECQVRMMGMSNALIDASNSAVAYGEFLSPVAASAFKLEPHAPTKTGCPFAIALDTVASGSVRAPVWLLGPHAGQNV